MNNWISVKDRLPEGNNMVLVCVRSCLYYSRVVW